MEASGGRASACVVVHRRLAGRTLRKRQPNIGTSEGVLNTTELQGKNSKLEIIASYSTGGADTKAYPAPSLPSPWPSAHQSTSPRCCCRGRSLQAGDDNPKSASPGDYPRTLGIPAAEEHRSPSRAAQLSREAGRGAFPCSCAVHSRKLGGAAWRGAPPSPSRSLCRAATVVVQPCRRRWQQHCVARRRRHSHAALWAHFLAAAAAAPPPAAAAAAALAGEHLF